MAEKKSITSLDIATLDALLEEANKHYNKAEKSFEKTDSTEDMHASEQWLATIHWLGEKITKQEKLNALRAKKNS